VKKRSKAALIVEHSQKALLRLMVMQDGRTASAAPMLPKAFHPRFNVPSAQ
jgi:hypothetical protein